MSETSSMGEDIPLTPSTTMEQMLEKILSEISLLKVNIGTLVDENIKRVREITTIRRKAGMKGEIKADYEGILASDKEDASVDSQNLSYMYEIYLTSYRYGIGTIACLRTRLFT